MILLISTCAEKLHELEFIKPIERILKEHNLRFKTKHYSERFNPNDFSKAIICGTSLQDNKFLKHLNKFKRLINSGKPVLGICAGMQILSLIYGARLEQKTEIGFYEESFKKEFLSLKGLHQVYHLHNNYTTLPKNFDKFNDGKIPQAIKHVAYPQYGVLFHPEVRNKALISNFLKDDTNL